MKNTLIILLLFAVVSVQAQNIVFKAANSDHTVGEILPDTVEALANSENDVIVNYECFISNISDNSSNVKIKREIVAYVSGAEDQLCWGSCTEYSESDLTVEKPEVAFSANETKFSGLTPNDEFQYESLGGVFHYQPKGNAGTTILKYTLISVRNGNETIEDVLVIKFIAGTTSISKQISKVNLSTPYPNPALSFTNVDYKFMGTSKANLYVTNVIGRQVASYVLQKSEGSIQINTNNLPQGMYFINIETKGKIIAHNKFLKQ